MPNYRSSEMNENPGTKEKSKKGLFKGSKWTWKEYLTIAGVVTGVIALLSVGLICVLVPEIPFGMVMYIVHTF